MLMALTAGCTVDRPSTPPALPEAPETAPRDDYGLAGVSCGEPALGHGEQVPRAMIDCLRAAARAGTAANLVVKAWTVEGDGVFTAYQVVGDGTVEVVHDSRWDAFGMRRLNRQRYTVAPDAPWPFLPGDSGVTPP